jgi:putative peptidoglycan lipid II flippase
MLLTVVLAADRSGTGWAPPHAGLALATSTAGLFNAARLLAGLRRTRVYRPRAGWRALGMQVSAGCAVMTVFLLWALERVGDWFSMPGVLRAGWLAACVLGAVLIYFATAYVLGFRPAAVRVGGQER